MVYHLWSNQVSIKVALCYAHVQSLSANEILVTWEWGLGDKLIPGITWTSAHGSPPPPILVNVKGMTPMGILLQYWH